MKVYQIIAGDQDLYFLNPKFGIDVIADDAGGMHVPLELPADAKEVVKALRSLADIVEEKDRTATPYVPIPAHAGEK